MDYKDLFTISVMAFISGIILFALSLILFFKLDIKSIVMIFIRKLKVAVILILPIFALSKEVGAKELYENTYSSIRLKCNTYLRDNTIFYPDLKGDYFTFFVSVKKPENLDTIEVFADEGLCYRSLSGDNLDSEIPVMLKKGYEPEEISIIFRAKTGNSFREIYKLKKDDEGPRINKDGYEISDAIGIIDFNKWIKAFITGQNLVTVKIKDVTDHGSGINSLYFKYYTENAEHTLKANFDEDTGEYYAHVFLPINSNRKFFVIARDNLYNITSTEEDFISIISDNTDPVIDIKSRGKLYESEKDLVYKDDISLEIKAEDLVGVKDIRVSLNDRKILELEDIYSKEGGLLKEYKFIVNKSDLSDYKNEVTIYVKNFGGYEASEKITVYSDNSAPIISESFVNGNLKDIGEDLEVYYSDKIIKVKAKIEDFDDFGMERPGKTEDINLLLYDINNNPLDVRKLECDKDGNIEFELQAGFKGYGVIKARDGFNNELCFKTCIFISESEDIFKKSSEILFRNENDDIHLEEVRFPILVKSYFSGIKEVRYKIISPNDTKENKSGRLDINGKYEDGLFVFGEGEILVSNNSNDIKVSVKLISNCGNTMEETIVLNIDRTFPVIDLKFLDGEDGYYINHNRTLRIEITERNFVRDYLSLYIIENGNNIGNTISFNARLDRDNPDNNKYIGELELKSDGKYSIYGGLRDTAGNTASLKEREFIIDKTKPKGELLYEKEPKEGEFINGAFIIRVRIEDANLDTSSVKIEGADFWDGNYSYEDGVFSSLIKFDKSGEYQVSVTGRDLAGNALNKLISNKFIIDLINPEILINNLINFKSYNGAFSFDGELKDEFLDTGNTKINLTKVSPGKNLNLYKEISPGVIKFGVEPVQKDIEYDGVYELAIIGKDFAGNYSEKSLRFSINRFGSVFIPSDDLTDISNHYTRVMGNLDILEVNYDSIDPLTTRVFLFRNGNTKLLNIEKDYEVTSINDGFLNSLTYSIKGSNFNEDGIYAVSIYSKDEAGNKNYTNKDDSLISFVVDRTPPRIYSLNLSSGEEYNKPVNMEIKAFDNMKLDSVFAFNNNNPIDIVESKGKYIIHLPVNSKKYNLRLCAKDSAGNMTETKINSLSVGYEKGADIYDILLKIFLLVFVVSIILLISIIKRRYHGKRKNLRAY